MAVVISPNAVLTDAKLCQDLNNSHFLEVINISQLIYFHLSGGKRLTNSAKACNLWWFTVMRDKQVS